VVARLIGVIEPLYPPSGRVGRQPIGVRRMLRMDCLQQSYGLADEAREDALYSSQVLRDVVGIKLSRESVPDATTLPKFRRLLLANDLSKVLFDEIDAHPAKQGLLMRAGTIVDATLITAPSSTKNEGKTRDPKMHQSKKGSQWHFGMKAHIGVNAESGLVHMVIATAANVNDVTQAAAPLHRDETAALGDAGYGGAHKREETQGARWYVTMQAGKRRQLGLTRKWARLTEQAEHVKASIAAKVEHPLCILCNEQPTGLTSTSHRVSPNMPCSGR
jgi:transposase, IS5 family